MIRDTAVARVKQMLGFKKNLDAEIVQAMIEVQEDLERSSELPDFLRLLYTGLATVALQKTLPVPTNFIREVEGDQLYVSNALGEETPVWKDEQGFLRVRQPVFDEDGIATPGIPKGYVIVNRVFQFYPTPDAVYTLNGTYYAKDATLATNVENKWMSELPFLIIARSGLLLAAGLRDQAGLTSFGQMNEIFTAKLHLMTTASDMAGMKPVMGGED